jgi:hypothetical protein
MLSVQFQIQIILDVDVDFFLQDGFEKTLFKSMWV